MNPAAIVETGATALAFSSLERACILLAEARTFDEVRDLRDQADAMRVYAKRRDAASTAHADAYEIVQRANRRLGELLREIPKSPGGRTDRPTRVRRGEPFKGGMLAELGIPKATAHSLEKLAALPEQEFLARIESARERITQQPQPGVIISISAASDYDGDAWGTPFEYLEAARTVLGGIELDPATNEKAQLRVQAERYYTREANGLKQPWEARSVWLAPPYSDPLVARFCNRFADAVAAETVGSGLVLVNACTETRWFQRLLGMCAVCFPSERVGFLDASGEPVKGNSFRQALLYAGPNLPLFADVFESFGRIEVEYRRAGR
jgi:phage N-6-adenine-methyltransferase